MGAAAASRRASCRACMDAWTRARSSKTIHKRCTSRVFQVQEELILAPEGTVPIAYAVPAWASEEEAKAIARSSCSQASGILRTIRAATPCRRQITLAASTRPGRLPRRMSLPARAVGAACAEQGRHGKDVGDQPQGHGDIYGGVRGENLRQPRSPQGLARSEESRRQSEAGLGTGEGLHSRCGLPISAVAKGATVAAGPHKAQLRKGTNQRILARDNADAAAVKAAVAAMCAAVQQSRATALEVTSAMAVLDEKADKPTAAPSQELAQASPP